MTGYMVVFSPLVERTSLMTLEIIPQKLRFVKFNLEILRLRRYSVRLQRLALIVGGDIIRKEIWGQEWWDGPGLSKT